MFVRNSGRSSFGPAMGQCRSNVTEIRPTLVEVSSTLVDSWPISGDSGRNTHFVSKPVPRIRPVPFESDRIPPRFGRNSTRLGQVRPELGRCGAKHGRIRANADTLRANWPVSIRHWLGTGRNCPHLARHGPHRPTWARNRQKLHQLRILSRHPLARPPGHTPMFWAL